MATHQRPVVRGAAVPAVQTTEHRLEIPAPAAVPALHDRRPVAAPSHECGHEEVVLHVSFPTNGTSFEKVVCKLCGRQLRNTEDKPPDLFPSTGGGRGVAGGFGFRGRGRGGAAKQPSEDKAWLGRVRQCQHPPEVVRAGKPNSSEATRFCGRCGKLLRPPLDDDY